jgi:hypothetical protein
MNERDAEQAPPLSGAEPEIRRPSGREGPVAVRVITAFRLGFSRSIRSRKCWVSSRLEISLAAKRRASSPMDRVCNIVAELN